MIYPIYVKPPMELFSKYTVLSRKKNMHHSLLRMKMLKKKHFKELKKTLLEQKYPKSFIEASILKAKATENFQKWRNSSFHLIYNSKNSNTFLIIKPRFNNFQYSKTTSNIFQEKKRINSMSQAPNLGRLLCRCKFNHHAKITKPKKCGKNCVSCPYRLKASLYQFKRVSKTFLLKNPFNCESSNLIYVVICQGCKVEYIGKTVCLVIERISIYRQHIRAVISTSDSWRSFMYLRRRSVSYVFFFQHSLRK